MEFREGGRVKPIVTGQGHAVCIAVIVKSARSINVFERMRPPLQSQLKA